MTTTPPSEFFLFLLDIESNIDSRELARIVADLETSELDYWSVEHPGRLVRQTGDGSPVRDRISVAEFLERTGVSDLFARLGSIGIRAVQAAVINPWGFVGYQFGEPLLIDLQYYRPAIEEVDFGGEIISVPSYYASSLPESTWQSGRRSFLFFDELSGHFRVGTDVNTWRGTFTGKDGVNSFEDLRRFQCQVAILRGSLRRSAAVVDRQLRRMGDSLWASGDRPWTAAGLMAASHLGGPHSVVEYLRTGAEHADEAGTAIGRYIEKFASVSLTEEDLH